MKALSSAILSCGALSFPVCCLTILRPFSKILTESLLDLMGQIFAVGLFRCCTLLSLLVSKTYLTRNMTQELRYIVKIFNAGMLFVLK